ncbi:MAG: patatin-like phospholipase family protein [Bacteroidetes bacterium]|nr:patatin-like phospholipase family protein [Bacteroidota bacterium]
MKKNIALVLSSGGARGFAHIGVINVLEKNGFTITSIAGTSMGALVGGIYATGQFNLFEEWVSSLNIKEVLKLTDFSISNKGLLKGSRIIKKMKELVPDRNIEDLPIPFCSVATDIINGTETVFTEGNLYDAIRASISIPTVFQPFKVGDNYFVDGGVLNPIPIDRVKRQTDDLLVVVDVNAQIPYEKRKVTEEKLLYNRYFEQIKMIRNKLNTTIPRNKTDHIGIFNLTNRSISLMLHKISLLTLEKHQPDLLINISRHSFGTYDFYKQKISLKRVNWLHKRL